MPDGRAWKYAWDGRGFLAEVTTPDSLKVAFEYDALGRRTRKTVSPA
jgi:YD repeat-containing protein